MKITANQVTLARIVLLPIPAAMLLFGPVDLHFVALIFFIFIGVGDLVDGWLARKQGPTKFGAMLDPLADKIFIASIVIPFSAQGRAPAWFAAALLSRELVVTALRTQMTLRGQTIQTSVLAKLKTTVQMAGFALVFFNEALPDGARGLMVVGVAAVALLTLLAVAIGGRGRVSVFVWFPCVMALLAAAVQQSLPRADATLALLLIILIITWGSGLDYLLGAFGHLRRGGLRRSDVARALWALGAVAACSLVAVRPGLAFAVVLVLTAELVVGGVDSLRALAEKPMPDVGLMLRGVLLITLSGFVHVAAAEAMPDAWIWSLSAALLLVSIGGALVESLRARAYMSGKALDIAYSSKPAPRSASE